MSIIGVYAILDKAADTYSRPFVYATDAVAIRELSGEVRNPESIYNKHTRDFSLYYFGTYDDMSGRFDLLPEPRFVIAALSLLPNEGE